MALLHTKQITRINYDQKKLQSTGAVLSPKVISLRQPLDRQDRELEFDWWCI